MKDLPYVLRILAGSTPGVEVPLRAFKDEIVIGRSDEADLVLDDAQASRRHARLFLLEGGLLIEDLGSTNGVYVNAQRIRARTPLMEGDRLQVGTSLLKLTRPRAAEPERDAATVAASAEELAEAQPQRRDPSRFSGSIGEIPLPDLVQLLATGRKSGLLVVQGMQGHGTLALRDGQIRAAAIGKPPSVRGLKALYRMIGWQLGDFEFRPPSGEMPDDGIDERADALLLESMRQLDELAAMQKQLPASHVKLVASEPGPELETLPPEQAALLELVRARPRQRVGTLVDASPMPDLETYQALIELSKAGHVRVDTGW